MVGPWPLAPYHDHLQYIHHIHLMQRGQNRGVTGMCAKGQIVLEFSLMWIRVTCLLAFHMP